jgi:hypothetical protein
VTQPIDWPRIVATSVCLLLAGAGALYFSTYEPKPFSAQELAASRVRNLANCGAGMFDVVPHAATCPRFAAIGMEVGDAGCAPGVSQACEAFTLTLNADGKAELVVRAPAKERGRYEASISSYEFRELSNLFASLALDRRGHVLPSPPDGEQHVVRAGCGEGWTIAANDSSRAGDIAAMERCLLGVKRRADWSLVRPSDAVTVD